MINVGDLEISGVYIGDEELSVYVGDELIYPMNFGTLTGISLDNLTWVTDVPANGGTATSANCSYTVMAYYDSGKSRKVTRYATITGSLVVTATTAATREMVGTLTLTASCSGFTDSDTVDVYQAAQTYNNYVYYTTTDNQILSKDFSSLTNYVSHSFDNNIGAIQFSQDLTSIPAQMFSGCTTLATVDIPETVTSYGSQAFAGCTGMQSFTIPSGITSIGAKCFEMTSGVLTIVDNQYAISGNGRTTSYSDGSNAFNYSFAGKWCGSTYKAYNGINFDKIIITGSTTMYVGSSAFHCSPATEIIVGDNINFVGGMAFARMTNEGYGTINKPFTSFTMGAGITSSSNLGRYLWFYGCGSSFKTIKWYPTVTYSANSAWFPSSTGTVHYKSGTSSSYISGLPSGWTIVRDL